LQNAVVFLHPPYNRPHLIAKDLKLILRARSARKINFLLADGKTHPLNYNLVKKLPEIDLAIVEFNSDQNYAIARLGDSKPMRQGDNVYVSGWPNPGTAITQPTNLINEGRIAGLQAGGNEEYELLYGNSTAPGMSGGSVLNNSDLAPFSISGFQRRFAPLKPTFTVRARSARTVNAKGARSEINKGSWLAFMGGQKAIRSAAKSGLIWAFPLLCCTSKPLKLD
jgi:hypothetical protein